MDLDLPQVVFSQGDLFYKNGGSYKIGYTMLETTGLPEEWVCQCNRMDEIWVPTEFNRQTFRQSGVTRPVHVIPLGINPELYHPGRTVERFSSRYTFLSVFEWGERKNPASLLRSYCRAFGPEDDVALVIKYSPGGALDLYAYLRELDLPEQSAPIVFMQCNSIAAHEMGPLYCGADCFVLPTHGEGWGMPMLEAMACGLPVLATDWSGQTAFMNEQNSYPIPVRELIPARALCPYYEGTHWAQVDEDALTGLLRHVAAHPDEAKAKGRIASQEVREKWTWSHSAEAIIGRLEKLGARP
jgi:glycosyltransferase involved in cell wall biosynthesis